MNETSAGGVTREVNMTPLIDVSLVLVVMLLLMTPLALESSFTVERAAEAGREEARDEVERVEIVVHSAEKLVLNEIEIARSDLAPSVGPLLAGATPPVVVVSCRDHVPHGVFVEVVDTVKRAGADEIAMIGK